MSTQNDQSINSQTENDNTESTHQISPIEKLIQSFREDLESSPTSYSAYQQKIMKILRDEIKPLCTRAARSSASSNTGWRTELNDRFKGRGAKWVYVEIDEVIPTLNRFDYIGLDTTDYRAWIKQHGKAWIRYAAGRILDGKPAAAFSIHLVGSTIPESKNLHLIDIEDLDNIITPMTATPKALNIESIKTNPETEKVEEVSNKDTDEITTTVNVEENNVEENNDEENNEALDNDAF